MWFKPAPADPAPGQPVPFNSAVPLLQAQALDCVRGDRLLFSRLELALYPGTLLQVEGPNGSGKTSLLRILCGLATPSHGEIRWRGQPVGRVRQEFMAEAAYIGHNHGVKGDLSPYENVRIARGLGRANTDISIDDALGSVGLAGFEDVPARSLSAGQRRRVALSRLLATQAKLWVLDEPLAALDIKGVALVERMISAHLAGGGAAIVTTHQPLVLAQGLVARLTLN